MGRRLFTILAAVSLLLCVITAVLWARSYWVADVLVSYSNPRLTRALSAQGRLIFAEIDFNRPSSPRSVPVGWYALQRPEKYVDWMDSRYLGFGVQDATFVQALAFAVCIPHWFVSALLLALPGRWFWIWRRSRLATRKGLCLKCAYDLRASKDRCPECGTPIPALAASSIGSV